MDKWELNYDFYDLHYKVTVTSELCDGDFTKLLPLFKNAFSKISDMIFNTLMIREYREYIININIIKLDDVDGHYIHINDLIEINNEIIINPFRFELVVFHELCHYIYKNFIENNDSMYLHYSEGFALYFQMKYYAASISHTIFDLFTNLSNGPSNEERINHFSCSIFKFLDYYQQIPEFFLMINQKMFEADLFHDEFIEYELKKIYEMVIEQADCIINDNEKFYSTIYRSGFDQPLVSNITEHVNKQILIEMGKRLFEFSFSENDYEGWFMPIQEKHYHDFVLMYKSLYENDEWSDEKSIGLLDYICC